MNTSPPDVPQLDAEDIAYASFEKIRHACEHFEILQNRITEFAKSDFYTITEERHLDRGHPLIRVDIKALPKDVPLIAGDVVHNLRSALDILWNTMIRRLGGDDSHSYFPICEKRDELKGTVLKADKVVTPAVPGLADFLIDQAKLYKTGDPPGNNVIFYLNQLDRSDKHRLPVIASKATGFKHITVTDKSYNMTSFQDVLIKDGITDLPSAFPFEFEKLTYSVPTTFVYFDMPDIFQTMEFVLPTLGKMGVAVFSLTEKISDLWRKTGRK